MGIFFPQPGRRYYLWLLGSLCLWLLGSTYTVQGQIVPDATLPNPTVVIPNGNTSVIEQGIRVGGNLFHSFSEFSLPTGGVAAFNNAPDIQNILSRVTGVNLSNIEATEWRSIPMVKWSWWLEFLRWPINFSGTLQ